MKAHAESSPSTQDIAAMSSKRAALRQAAAGFLVCTIAASVITIILRNIRGTESLPLLFLVVVGLVAHRFGTSGAILGLISGAFVFAMFLFEPLGQLAIEGHDARTNLVMMLLFGMAVAYFYGASQSSDDETGEQKK